ncbi:hypothetical protein DERF_001123 [Dermatophagoides farinae]|uniref:Uncharacterized protein n=1 Tax=Dermatophagoides farinae TaxID=6954 RepID=A0A922L926_DERFA|nr:hypothetical protein DERF_001123 [Dermatophagoides farinae]
MESNNERKKMKIDIDISVVMVRRQTIQYEDEDDDDDLFAGNLLASRHTHESSSSSLLSYDPIELN